jgi:20S proteasome subunit alpha 5
LAVEKRLTSPLLEAHSIEKIIEIDFHVGAAMSGLSADARILIDHARVEAQSHRFTYDEPMKTRSIVQAICDMKIGFGESGDNKVMSRPFGVSLLVAGVDKDGKIVLYHTDPSGTFVQFGAKAIGSGSEGAQTTLEEQYNSSLTLEEAQTIAMETLKQVMEEKISTKNVEVAVVTPADGYQMLDSAEVQIIIDRC